jgi:menaquinone-dependent protoporphyrinogen oxidase
MTVLVTAASRHGSTDEIARIVAGILDDSGVDAEIRRPDDVTSVDRYEAVVIGSAVYMGRWMDPAMAFVRRFGPALAQRPVWLFSSGPLGEPAKPDGDPVDADAVRAVTGARDHRTFPGRLDRSELGLGERLVVKGVRAPYGDFRPWSDIADWAMGIARTAVAGRQAVEEPTSAPTTAGAR